jgi:dihydroneopterin aldolase
MTDYIRLNEMVFYGYHGVLAEEQTLGQRFVVDVEMVTDLRPAGISDELTQTVNYAAVYATVRDIATAVLADHPTIERLTVRVRKPSVPIGGAVLASAEVVIERVQGDARA